MPPSFARLDSRGRLSPHEHHCCQQMAGKSLFGFAQDGSAPHNQTHTGIRRPAYPHPTLLMLAGPARRGTALSLAGRVCPYKNIDRVGGQSLP